MEQNSQIIPITIEDTMQEAYLEYAMSVIVGRALPDVRDGLKPVHRRILFAMHEVSNTHDKPYKKSARIVGDVIGKYHPHGDSAVYEALVRMAQEFSLRYPLIEGQGNFGSIDGDGAAAMRYTEVRMEKITASLLADLEKETVEFIPNYDGHQFEPTVLPTKIPNLLINGSSGIAVGMATNIPPHNLGEVVDACLLLIDKPDSGIKELIEIVKGPDFPTGGIIVGTRGILEAYTRGHGSLKLKGRAEIETYSGSRERIVINELPYQVNKARLIERIAELVKEKQIEGISDLRDESSREGIRVVVELKKDASAQVVLNQILNFTSLQTNFSFNMIAIDGKRPRLMGLKDVLVCFINHRKDVVTRRCLFELKEAEERAHIVEGLVKAIEMIDPIIALIKAAENPNVAREGLISKFHFSEKQAQAILDLRLQRLTGLERNKLEEELKNLKTTILELKEILASETRLMKVIREELAIIREQFKDTRRTEIQIGDDEELDLEDLVEDEDVIVTISSEGYVKRMPVSDFNAQNRGGRGRIGANTKQDEDIIQMFSTTTHSSVLFLTNLGRIYVLKVYRIPEAARGARGKNVVNLIQTSNGEKVVNILSVKEFNQDEFLILATKKGLIKKSSMEEYSKINVRGKYAITFESEADTLMGSRIVRAGQEVMLSTQNGMANRFSESDVRAMGATAMGVKGITLEEDDQVVSLEVCDDTSTLLVVTENGIGKRSPVNEYRLTNRGSKGVITLRATPKTGKLAAVLQVKETDHVMVLSDQGKLIRTEVSQIPNLSRTAQGVRIISLNEGEKVAAVTRVPEEGPHEGSPVNGS